MLHKVLISKRFLQAITYKRVLRYLSERRKIINILYIVQSCHKNNRIFLNESALMPLIILNNFYVSQLKILRGEYKKECVIIFKVRSFDFGFYYFAS